MSIVNLANRVLTNEFDEREVRMENEVELRECEVIGTARGLVERFELNGALNVEFWVKELKRAIERLDEARERLR